ncbi:hypothetical protein like AT5G04885 [Hibiscus trionum]|uniref:Glycoside hydrolase family 3 N-terminal domain-containing protein n=1 Tax=Hibiscus trionum TaxID=183268 RepID=A0A9W7MLA2_HIBTR|nr:hypothetical protein like AT5G04885 [Hibiscus trionum]
MIKNSSYLFEFWTCWGESYREDPLIVQAMTKMVLGLQGDIPANCPKGIRFAAGNKKKVAACAKHYVGDGETTGGINENNTVIS